MTDPNGNGRRPTTRRASALRFETLNAFFDSGTARGLRRSDAIVWLALFRHARPDRTVRVSINRLAEMTGKDRVTISRSIGRLLAANLLVRRLRGTPGQSPTTYKIRPFDPDKRPDP